MGIKMRRMPSVQEFRSIKSIHKVLYHITLDLGVLEFTKN